MGKRFYLLTRDLHLYFGLFISPFVLVFAISVFFLVHSWVPGAERVETGSASTVSDLVLPPGLDQLSGRQRVDALRPLLEHLGVTGELGSVRYLPKEHRLLIPVIVPGRETTVAINMLARTAEITRHTTGIWDATITLHKSPGPHLAAIRMNWFPMRVWRWFADATAYLLLFTSISGIYLWVVLRAERRIGLSFLSTGAISFFAIAYALSH